MPEDVPNPTPADPTKNGGALDVAKKVPTPDTDTGTGGSTNKPPGAMSQGKAKKGRRDTDTGTTGQSNKGSGSLAVSGKKKSS